jgi:hypothetical protein
LIENELPDTLYKYFCKKEHADALCDEGVILISRLSKWASAGPPHGDSLEGLRTELHVPAIMFVGDQLMGDDSALDSFNKATALGFLPFGFGGINTIFSGNTFIIREYRYDCYALSFSLTPWDSQTRGIEDRPFGVSICNVALFIEELSKVVTRDLCRCDNVAMAGEVVYDLHQRVKHIREALFHKSDRFLWQKEYRVLFEPSNMQGMCDPRTVPVPGLSRLCSRV